MRQVLRLNYLLGVSLLLCTPLIAAPEVTIYTTYDLPAVFSREPATRIYLDEPQRMMQTLSATRGISNRLSTGQVMRVISQKHGQHYFREVGRANAGLVQAWGHGITDLPAIVIDDHYVIYGIYDVRRARDLLAKYLLRKGGRQR